MHVFCKVYLHIISRLKLEIVKLFIQNKNVNFSSSVVGVCMMIFQGTASVYTYNHAKSIEIWLGNCQL